MELRLRFQKIDPKLPFDAPVPVSAHFDGTDTEVFDFVNPLNDTELRDIRWYLELYPQWPVGPDYDRAQDIEAKLPQWGRALFNAVFDRSAKAMRLFERFLERRVPPSTLTLDTTEPRILRLPWELLADEGGYLFSKQPAVNVRRRLHKISSVEARQFDLPARILMVTCRPEQAGFIDPRSIAAPLLDALHTLGDQVEIEFLRPPTLTALTRRVRDPHSPPVHVVHFDGHGVYDPVVGLGFLLFEDDEHNADRVDAEQLGTLLNECGIPLMVLNACQSAQPDDRNPFGSVAARLIESGVGGVVAMNYSVLVKTAELLTGHFYGALAQGHSVGAALDFARLELLSNKNRLKLYRPDRGEEIIKLQDWFLPALYQQEDELTPFGGKTTEDGGWRTEAGGVRVPVAPARGGFPAEPNYGFHGRARELLTLERAFAKHPIVLLHGFGGQGKTALAAHTARWFTRAGMFERAAFVSFESGAGLEVVLAELGNALVSEDFAIHQGDPIQAIADALRATPTLVVWDNFETILPNGDIPLPPDALKSLLDAGASWFSSDATLHSPPSTLHSSRLLITTRDTSLPHPAYDPGRRCAHRQLDGLLPADALELAATILEDRNLPRPPRESLSRLLDFLGGHPLSIQLVLPHLRETPDVEKLIEEFDELLPGFTLGEGKARNQSLEVSLRFSLRRLGAEAQAILPRLAVFQGGAIESQLLKITEIDEALWAKLKPELARAALIRLEELPGITVPYIHFHPTLAPYLQRLFPSNPPPSPEADTLRESETSPLAASGEGPGVGSYWPSYYSFANSLYQTDYQYPLQARALAAREMPNLRRALALAVQAGALDEAVDFADRISYFLNNFGRWRERDEIAELVRKAMEGRRKTEDGGRITKAEYLLESGRGERLLQQGRAAQAEGVFRALLVRLEAGAEYDASYHQMLVLSYLGRCLADQGKPVAAAERYRAALGAAEALEQTKIVRSQKGYLHADLADVLSNLGQYDEARSNYEQSLMIAKRESDDRSAAVALGQLGTLALAQNNLLEARHRYTEALETFRRMGEAQSEAALWHQLGVVAGRERDWDEAERCYKESLGIEERLGNVAGAAQTCNQLALLAEGAGRLEQAERWYLQSIELSKQVDDRLNLSRCYNNLAGLLFAQDRLEEAETYAHRAREIKETLDLSVQPWTTYNILAQIAERRGRVDEAREWRRKERETFAAFAGSDQAIKQWEPVIADVVAACQGNMQATTKLEPFLQQMGATEDWRHLISVIRRVMAGERGEELYEGLDRVDALIIRRILEGVEGRDPHPPAPSPATGEGGAEEEGKVQEDEQGGITLPQLLELVERAAGGDSQLGAQLFPALQKTSVDPNAPPELCALASVLVRVLAGERQPNLDDLPGELASMVRGMLGRMKRTEDG